MEGLSPVKVKEKAMNAPDHIILYHGTLTQNVPFILENGILPKPAEYGDIINYISEILFRFGIPLEGKTSRLWKWGPLGRLQEAPCQVFLTMYREYAMSQATAGMEAERQLIMHCLQHLSHKDPHIKKELKEVRVWNIPDEPASIITLSAPVEDLPVRTRKHFIRTYEKYYEGSPKMERWTEMERTLEQAIEEHLAFMFREVRMPSVPRSWIIGHEDVTEERFQYILQRWPDLYDLKNQERMTALIEYAQEKYSPDSARWGRYKEGPHLVKTETWQGKKREVSPGQYYTGVAYHVDQGYRHDPGQTAEDIVKWEEEVYENDLRVPASIRPQLKEYQAKNTYWITLTKKADLHYGSYPQKLELENALIIGTDGEDGYLIYDPGGKKWL